MTNSFINELISIIPNECVESFIPSIEFRFFSGHEMIIETV